MTRLKAGADQYYTYIRMGGHKKAYGMYEGGKDLLVAYRFITRSNQKQIQKWKIVPCQGISKLVVC